MFEIKFTDNSGKILKTLKANTADALSEAGALAVSYAKSGAPVGTPDSTGIPGYHGGKLKNSIDFKVIGDSCFAGTDVKSSDGTPYAVYAEFGTGVFSDSGNGRKTPWVWFDQNGDAHYTRGIRPSHFLKNALQDHIPEYLRVLLKNR